MLLNESVRSVLVCVARATYSPRRLFRCGRAGGGWRWKPMRARYSVLARARERQRPFSTNLPHPYVITPRATPHLRHEIADRGCRLAHPRCAVMPYKESVNSFFTSRAGGGGGGDSSFAASFVIIRYVLLFCIK